MATQCPKCQTENPDTAKFCSECATPLQPSKDIGVTKTIETPAKEFTRGTTFADRYEIIEVLGRGGMGTVFKAEDTKIGQDIALKLIKPEIASDKKTIERFRNELKTTRMISHRNVCRMFDLGDAEGKYFITMEYIPGEDLKSFIRRVGQLPSGKAISIAKQVCEGLAEAHRLGVVHRDLKSNNVMIDEEGNARIMDFGIARSLRTKGFTGEGIIIGTPEYMSPEQAEAKEIDHRSDIYSLGVILYEMVTGQLPFEGDTPLSIAMKHKGEIPKNPKELNPQIQEDLNILILKCLEKDKEKRFQSAEELHAGLDDIEKGIPTEQRVVPKRRPLTSKEITVTFGLKKLLIPAFVLVVLIVAAVFIWQLLPQKEVTLAPKIENSIAVISFENRTGDRAYDQLQEVIPDLLITNLENTGFFYVATWERMSDLLNQMGKGGADFIDGETGFELCRREGIKALAKGSYAKVGETFVTDVKVFDVDTKRLLKSASARGEGEDSILIQIDELSKTISESMGLSSQTIETAKFDIREVTTTSIEAYKYFIKGREDYEKYYRDEARESMEKAVILDPEFAMAYLYLGRSSRGKARIEAFEKAKTFSSKATQKERLYIEASYAGAIEHDPEKALRILKGITNKYPQEAKRVHYELGLRFQHGYPANLDKALEEYDKALEIDPSYGLPLNESAFIYAALENYEKAIECLERYVSVSPGNANSLDSLASNYFRAGRVEKAEATFREALAVKPDWTNSYAAIGYINALNENYSEAMNWIEQGIAKARAPERIHLHKVFYYFWLGRMDQSLEEIRITKVLANSRGNSWVETCADFMEGFIYEERGQHERARGSLKNWLNFWKKRSPGTRYRFVENTWLGRQDLRDGRIDSAKARLAEIKSLLPETGSFNRLLYKPLHDALCIEVLLAEGAIEKAVDAGKKLACGPDPIAAFQIAIYNEYISKDVLAQFYVRTGELDKAVAEYERLMTFDPESKDTLLIHPLYHYSLAKLYEQKGLKIKAIEQYERFIDLYKDADPGIIEVEDAHKRLESLNASKTARES